MQRINDNEIKIVFLNQVVGPLFRELAEDISKVLGPGLLYTGQFHTGSLLGSERLIIVDGPSYNRKNNVKRLISWLHYFFKSIFVIRSKPNKALLLIVSNPPFLGLVGLFFKLLRKQPYAILVYDVYPDVLLALGTMKEGVVPCIWRFLNRLILERADLIFTISRDMSEQLEMSYDMSNTATGAVVVIPNWADITYIRPISKEINWFARQHDQIGKTTVLYSGNMGNTHDIGSIVDAARKLRTNERIQFLFIGSGAKTALVERAIKEEKLVNIRLLPLQPEEVLPYSMATGDIGIVSYQPGTEGCIVPSKIYYYMAAGVAPLILCDRETDLSRMAEEHRCGVVVRSGDSDALVQAILRLDGDAALLLGYKQRARVTVEQLFSRANTQLFINTIIKYIHEFNSAEGLVTK